MDKLLSIIISVYNKEKYLPKCVESLIKLNIDKGLIEAIFIDDLSTDDSYNIIQHYSKEYDFIKVIQLDKNSGSPSIPRNIGISKAQGKYITLLDADDWLDSEGFPQLLYQMEEHSSDIGFGQCFKHTNSSVSRMARFASYKYDNYLVPYEIEKIFRAVGPPGKIFKKEIVNKNNIKFEHMRFAEDKLFFIELISNCNSASMNPAPVYHVNRFRENKSLVKTTNVLEKAEINLSVLEKILGLEIPHSAKQQAISRIIEVDFFRRFFHTKTFLKSLEKDLFYDIFNRVIELLNDKKLDIKEYVYIDRFENILNLYQNYSRKYFTEYLEFLVFNESKSEYICDGVVIKKFPDKFKFLKPVFHECIPIYLGTHKIANKYYEVIQVYKSSNTIIDSVLLSKIGDESTEKEIQFILQEDKLYLNSNDLNFNNLSINLRIKYDNYKSSLVYSSFPNSNFNYLQKRQSFKTELSTDVKSPNLPVDEYISLLPKYIVALRELNCYSSQNFNDIPVSTIEEGTKIEIKEILKTKRGTPRLKTSKGFVITANKKYVKPLNTENINGYITEKTSTVRILKKCKVYTDRNFQEEPIEVLNTGDEIPVKKVVYTNKLTPRLQTADDRYITANLNFVEII